MLFSLAFTRFLKTTFSPLFLLILLSASLSALNVYAEGTRELMPAAGTPNYLQFFDNNDIARSFASYIADDEHALKISVANPGEVIYFGFRPEAILDGTGCNRLWYRIRDPLGNIVFGPQECTITGAGSIANYVQAIVGPNTLIGGAGGYTPLFYEPVTPGDYTIEFNRNNPNAFVNTTTNCTGSRVKSTLILADITVADGLNGNALPGRLWSKTWDCTSASAANPMNNSFFVYDNDGYVFEVNLNGAQPFGFEFRANYNGLSNTGNVIADRRSRTGNSGFGELRVFLNDPDPSVFPSGITPGNISLNALTACGNGSYCIELNSPTSTQARLIYNLNGIPGFQLNTSDRDTLIFLSGGDICIAWDGRDGLGNFVPDGTPISFEIETISRAIHLPLFDIENNPNGFIISGIRPSATSNVNLFYDDLAILGGTANLSGCNTCHVWSGTLAPDGLTSITNWGNARTINTWFYASFNASIASPTLTYFSQNIEAGAAQTICAPEVGSTISLNGTANTSAVWSSSGDGTFSPNASNLNNVYTFGAADIASGETTFLLTSNPVGLCTFSITDSLTSIFEAIPNVSIDNTLRLITEEDAYIDVQAVVTNSPSMYWLTDGNGTFSEATSSSTRYFPSPEDKLKGSVSLSAWSNGQVACAAQFGIITVNITTAPCNEPLFPEAFSPNEDNLNDFFVVLCLSSVAKNLFEVYDRDGKKVFEANNYSNQWNGLNVLGQELPDDTYYYTFRSQDALWKGAVEIRR